MEQPEPHAPNAAAAKSDHAFAPLSDSAMPLLIVWDAFENEFFPPFFLRTLRQNLLEFVEPHDPRGGFATTSTIDTNPIGIFISNSTAVFVRKVVGVVLLCCMCAAIGNLSASRQIKRIKGPGALDDAGSLRHSLPDPPPRCLLSCKR